MMFEKKPKFRIVLDENGQFIVLEWWPLWRRIGVYVVQSRHETFEQAEIAISLLARAGTVVAEYDYPPLTRRVDRVS